jgi:3',5'-nucleoside bisphosphate phosphatase
MKNKSIMNRPFRITVYLIIILIPLFELSGQVRARTEINIPDIPGYLTLKCDFHMHTVFSDGDVWPTVRVEEAWREGLDAIAITDHIENQPSKKDIKENHNRPYEIALSKAKSLNIILIRGGEITRSMPPGHFNAIFLKNTNLLDIDDWRDAIKAAIDQGAFVMWNHPGWQQPNIIPIWYDEHEEIYKNGWMHGMEIVNEREYYPLAQKWCMDKNITMIGNSDIHSPTNMFYDFSSGEKRACNLVFVKERTEDSIKEAMFNRRTAVFFNNMLMGEKEYLQPIFQQSIKLDKKEITIKGKQRVNIQIHNSSDVPFKLVSTNKLDEISKPEQITLHANQTTLFEVRGTLETLSANKTLDLNYEVKNLKIASDEGLPVTFKIKVHFQKVDK